VDCRVATHDANTLSRCVEKMGGVEDRVNDEETRVAAADVIINIKCLMTCPSPVTF
jgi:hypothetical protein